MIYVDTSVIVSLYARETHSSALSKWLKKNNEAIPLTGLHELELTNALRLKQFRNELLEDEVDGILERLSAHVDQGIYYAPIVEWTEVFHRASHLASAHTGRLGSRSLDILHIAIAGIIGADRLLTADLRQTELAKAAGLRIENWQAVS